MLYKGKVIGKDKLITDYYLSGPKNYPKLAERFYLCGLNFQNYDSS
jgi:hypothetical protein